MIKILVCVNNLILSEGVKRVISENLAEALVNDFISGPDLDEPDIVLFDSRETIERLRHHYAKAKFVCLDLGLKGSELACLLLCHGINGIISPSLDVNMFCKALRTVHSGEIWIEQAHLKTLLLKGRSLPGEGSFKGLSEQDWKIIAMVAEGLKNREIADQLYLSESTVKAHLSRIYKSLKVTNRAELVALTAASR